jgi:glycosyltransferase involved in cell wall biosynthesis
MRFLFIHQNFPGQFRHILRALIDRGHVVVGIGGPTARPVAGVRLERYEFQLPDVSKVHPFARTLANHSHRAERVLGALQALARDGFEPDTIVVHPGWGECLPIRAIFGKARLITYCEFYHGADMHSVDDPILPNPSQEGRIGVTLSNASNLFALVDADDAFAPTHWQRSGFPPEFQSKIRIIHEGIDTAVAAPSNAAFVQIGALKLSIDDEVITYVSRNLEPVRGFHIFMRALPAIMRLCPNAHVLVVGGDRASYSSPVVGQRSWREHFFDEIASEIDPRRLHFVGTLRYADYLQVLKISTTHVYLTHPFVLSWSMLEAMSCGCLVVGSDTAPVREVIDGSNGVLVPLLDADALARTVADCVKSRGTLRHLRVKARSDVIARYERNSVCLPQTLTFFRA